MRRLYGSLLAVVCVSSVALGQAPPAIRLPIAPILPSPMPPAPKAVNGLAAGELYVIDSDKPLIVLASPEGVVKMTPMEGPATVFGKFVDGKGENESRVVKGKTIVIVEAATTGRVELLIVPTGATATKDVLRVMLDVTGARPPPDDDKKKDVDPPAPIAAAWVIVVEETMARTPAVAAVLSDSAYWSGLKAKGISWRFYDKDSADAKAKKYDQFAAEVGLPAVLFLDKSGKVLKKAKLPANTAGIDELMKGAK